MYYSHKYAEAENGGYVTQLLSCVESRGLTDAIRKLSSKELLRAVRKFAEYDPTHSGIISQADFARVMTTLGERTGRTWTATRLRAMFEHGDLTGTGEIDFNEFVLMQQKREKKPHGNGAHHDTLTLALIRALTSSRT